MGHEFRGPVRANFACRSTTRPTKESPPGTSRRANVKEELTTAITNPKETIPHWARRHNGRMVADGLSASNRTARSASPPSRLPA